MSHRLKWQSDVDAHGSTWDAPPGSAAATFAAWNGETTAAPNARTWEGRTHGTAAAAVDAAPRAFECAPTSNVSTSNVSTGSQTGTCC